MLQILIWLLAFYLVLKGVEIFQIGLANPNGGAGKAFAMLIGAVSVLVSIVAAGWFVKTGDEQAVSVSRSSSFRP